MQSRNPHLVHGAVGGAIAGAVVMFWFLALDVMAGEPLATPTALAGALLHRQAVTATIGVLVVYSLLHYGIFVLLGVGAAAGMKVLGIKPALRHGVIFGLGVLNAVHYGAFLATDAQIVAVLPAIHVVAANLAGGMAMMAYLHRAEGVEQPLGLSGIKQHRLLVEGATTGLVGAAAVAIWFLVLDIFALRPFFTPAALGSALFLGAASPGEVQVTIGLVAGYTVFHVGAFVAVGSVLVWMSDRVERMPGLWMLAFMSLIIMEVGFLGAAALLGTWVLGALGGWLAVVTGNLLSVAAMGRWIWVTRPGLREKLIARPLATMM